MCLQQPERSPLGHLPTSPSRIPLGELAQALHPPPKAPALGPGPPPHISSTSLFGLQNQVPGLSEAAQACDVCIRAHVAHDLRVPHPQARYLNPQFPASRHPQRCRWCSLCPGNALPASVPVEFLQQGPRPCHLLRPQPGDPASPTLVLTPSWRRDLCRASHPLISIPLHPLPEITTARNRTFIIRSRFPLLLHFYVPINSRECSFAGF